VLRGGGYRPILELFKCFWLDLGNNLIGSCGVRTGGPGVSMNFMGPDKGSVVTVSRTGGPRLVGIFAAGASPSDAASPSEVGGEGVKGSGKWGTVAY
jgi:hypothetical protein